MKWETFSNDFLCVSLHFNLALLTFLMLLYPSIEINIFQWHVFAFSSNNPQTHPIYSAFQTLPMMSLFLEQMKSIIEKNLAKRDLDVHLLERELGMSRTNIHRKLAVLAHMSATEFIRFVRLTKASQLLRGDKDKTIAHIADEVGFKNYSYFTRCFHKLFGMSPRKWREGDKP